MVLTEPTEVSIEVHLIFEGESSEWFCVPESHEGIDRGRAKQRVLQLLRGKA